MKKFNVGDKVRIINGGWKREIAEWMHRFPQPDDAYQFTNGEWYYGRRLELVEAVDKTRSDHLDDLAEMDSVELAQFSTSLPEAQFVAFAAAVDGDGNGAAYEDIPIKMFVNVKHNGSVGDCWHDATSVSPTKHWEYNKYILNTPAAMLAAGYVPADQVVSVKALVWEMIDELEFLATPSSVAASKLFDMAKYGYTLVSDLEFAVCPFGVFVRRYDGHYYRMEFVSTGHISNLYQFGVDPYTPHTTSDDAKATAQSLYDSWALSANTTQPATPYQSRVHDWIIACFGAEVGADQTERNHRFLEESLELVQSLGCTQSEAHQLVDYVFGREVGEPAQEVGGVMNTLAALCTAADLDMVDCGEIELTRVWTKVEKIRAKQAAKPKHSPLPQHATQPADEVRNAALQEAADKVRNLWAFRTCEEVATAIEALMTKEIDG